jgi:hypothetical protein
MKVLYYIISSILFQLGFCVFNVAFIRRLWVFFISPILISLPAFLGLLLRNVGSKEVLILYIVNGIVGIAIVVVRSRISSKKTRD